MRHRAAACQRREVRHGTFRSWARARCQHGTGVRMSAVVLPNDLKVSDSERNCPFCEGAMSVAKQNKNNLYVTHRRKFVFCRNNFRDSETKICTLVTAVKFCRNNFRDTTRHRLADAAPRRRRFPLLLGRCAPAFEKCFAVPLGVTRSASVLGGRLGQCDVVFRRQGGAAPAPNCKYASVAASAGPTQWRRA